MARNWPTVITEVAFNADPNSTTTPTWTDLSRRDLGFTIKRGRTYELAQADAGTATLTLANTDGALDPSNTSSAYYPNLKIYRAARVRANYSGTTYSLVTGYAERWPQHWDADQFGSDPVVVIDGMTVLAATTLQSLYKETILAETSLEAYWPMQEASGVTIASDASGMVVDGNLTKVNSKYGAVTNDFGGTTSLADGSTCWTTAGSGNAAQAASTLTAANTSPAINTLNTQASVEFWLRTSATPASGGYCFVSHSPATAIGLAAYVNPSGKLVLWSQGQAYAAGVASPASMISTTTQSVNDGAWHHVVLAYSWGVSPVNSQQWIYVDASPTTTTFSGGVGVYAGELFIAAQDMSPPQFGGIVDAGNAGYGLNGSLAHAAIYATPLAQTQVTAHYNMGKLLVAGDGPGARIGRVLNVVPWRLGATTTDVDTSTFQAASDWAGATPLAVIQSVAADAGGVFYIDGSGAARWQSRATRFSTTASAYVFGDGVGELPYTEIAFDYDPTYVYNDVTISRNGGTDSTATNTASEAAYFRRTYTATSHLQAQTQTDDVANWIANTYKAPAVRPSVIEIVPSSNAALWPAALGTDIGTRVTVNRRAPGGSHTISVPCFVEGVEHQVDPEGDWRTRFTLSPVLAQPLIWDDASTVWDSNVWGY